ncbi:MULTISPECIES: hypothetical protein [Clostridium]|uniref:hypothetical protein n=1 Tax=Clostridium TaxID=1485 RepID=UPI000DFBC888|nr:hypothetical protein [Clostridium sporogenes]MCW6085495.1 hypothetical protein [Clostridium sporogenes]STC83915.1 Uncharacterised protein [Clostridium botulinum]
MDIELIKNTIIKDSPNFFKQRLINLIVENGIGTYKFKQEPNLIQLKNKSINEKIKECIDKEPLTIKMIDLLEINKGYRYSAVFEYDKLDMASIQTKCIDINSEYYKEIGASIDELEKLYLEDDKQVFIKFHKKISILEKGDNPTWYDVRYPIIIIFHKHLKLLEVRFDRINTDKEKGYYKIAIETCLSWLSTNASLKYKYINLDGIIRYIIDSPEELAKELIWAGELQKSQGITLKAGEDMTMPFFDQLKIEIKKWKQEYKDKQEAINCLNEVEDYLNKTKKYANDKFRTLRVIKYKKNGKYILLDEPIDLKITFNYGETLLDLINIYDNELNDMERINYVIEIIGGVRKSIKELQNKINR